MNFELFLGLAVLLTLVTLIGHGIWLLLALLFRALRGKTQPRPGRKVANCPVCAASVPRLSTECVLCGWQRENAGFQSPLRIAARQLDRLKQRNLIDADTCQQIVELLAREEQAVIDGAGIVGTPRAATPPSSTSFTAAAAAEDEVVIEAELVAPDEPRTSEATEPSIRATPDTVAETASGSASPIEPEREPANVSPESRARVYAERRRAVAEQPSYEALPEKPRIRPPTGDLLAAFMEEKNIRWGELVGGLLIVTCSVALVLSFWSQIAARPILKFGVFNGVTAALFGIGLHAAKRWKLPTTSHGLLTIATLLVPLNFLAIAAFAGSSQPGNPIAAAGETVSVVGFAALVYFAGRVIVPSWPLALTVGVLGTSIAQLVIRRLIGPDTHNAELYAVGIGTLSFYVAVNAWMARDALTNETLDEGRANAMFRQLGITTFAVFLAGGLLLFKTEAVLPSLSRLAPLVCLAAIPALSSGLTVWRRTIGTTLSRTGMAGTAIAVSGVAVMAAGVILAWPQPDTLTVAAAISFAVLTALALGFGIPEAHLAAGPCFALGNLLVCHVVAGRLSWRVESPGETVDALLSAFSGVVFVGAVFVPGLMAAGYSHFRRTKDALYCSVIAAVAAGCSVALVTIYGFGVPGDPEGVTWVYALYAVAALAASALTRKSIASWIGGALLLAAVAQAIVYRFDGSLSLDQPWLTVFLVHASIVAGGAAIARYSRSIRSDCFVDPLTGWALFSSSAALFAMAGIARTGGLSSYGPHVLWLSGVWLAISWMHCWPWLFTGFQIALTSALVLFVDSRLSTAAWYWEIEYGWCDPRSLQAQGVAVAVLSLAWIVLRVAVRRLNVEAALATASGWRETASRLLLAQSPRFDRLVLGVTVGLLLALSTYGALPGTAQELSPRGFWSSPETFAAATSESENAVSARVAPDLATFEIIGVPHAPALSQGTWILLAVLLVVLAAGLWEHFTLWTLGGMAVTVASGCLLLAGRWEPQVAVASALRWYTAGFFLIGSVAAWLRRPGRLMARQLGFQEPSGAHERFAYHAFVLLLFLTAAPLLAMGVFVAVSALNLRPPDSVQIETIMWLAAVFTVCALAGLVMRQFDRDPIEYGAESEGNSGPRYPLLRHLSSLFLVLGAAPLVVVTLFVVGTALSRHPIVGPEPRSFFANLGLSASYAVPLLVIAVSLVGHAISLKSSRLALAAGLLMNFCASAAYLLSPSAAGQLGLEQWLRLAQLNAIVSAGYTLGWIALLRWSHATSLLRTRAASPLATQLGFGIGFAALNIVPATLMLFFEPDSRWPLENAAGAWGWTSVVLVISAVAAFYFARRATVPAALWTAAMTGTAAMTALQSHRWDNGDWLAFHVLLVAQLAASWCFFAVAWIAYGTSDLASRYRSALHSRLGARLRSSLVADNRDSDELLERHRNAAIRWTAALAAAPAMLSLRAVAGDPQLPWWSVFALASIGVLMATLACWSRRHRFVYAAGVLVNLATTIWWVSEGHKLIQSGAGLAALFEFILVNVIALALPVAVWLLIDLWAIRPWTKLSSSFGPVGFHRVAAAISVLSLMAVIACSLLSDAFGHPVGPNVVVGWLAVTATLAAAGSCLWDGKAKMAVAGMYLLGLVVVGMSVDVFDLPVRHLIWTGTMIVAAYGLGTSYLWSRRKGLRQFTDRLRIAHRTEDEFGALWWLAPANVVLAASVFASGFWVVLRFDDLPMRLSASQAMIAQAFSVGLLARGRRESQLRLMALLAGVAAAVGFGWSWINPVVAVNIINHAVVVAVAIAGMTVLYAVGLAKLIRRDNEWTRAAQRITPALVVLGAATLVVVLATEILLYVNEGIVDMAWPAILAVAVTLATLTAACLLAAIVPGRDPLGLTERQRTAYVYVAEAMMALAFLHIRLTMPWLFRGFFQQYWPLIVMLIAFVGIGLGEFFRRARKAVLAEPLEKTGALLPMLPVIGYWVAPANVDYSLVMLVVGLLYAGLSVMRRSFAFGILAALAANGGLWYLLQRTEGLGVLDHPQLWLIPPSLCVLVAAYLNRERLSDSQMTSIRYLTSTTIYTASTADVFLNGVAQAPWLPLILAAFSIAGIFAGIMLRVRAFLFLGLSFLVLSLLTVIWHAAVDLQQTWIWFVSGIVAGILIIGMFALFEKKRQEVLQIVEGLKEWDA